MARTYVNITRDEFEDWLDSLHMGVWTIHPKYKSIYLIALSPSVAVSVRSTVGAKDKAMGRGYGSGAMKMVSTVTGQVLNKKAMGQKHFARTTNWRTNWKKGLDRIVKAYKDSRDFYEAIARIPDRQVYQAEIVQAIEEVPNWQDIGILQDFHGRVRNGGILTGKQRDLLDRELAQAAMAVSAPQPDPPASAPGQTPKPGGGLSQDDKVEMVRNLWRAARRAGDDWTTDFAKSIGLQLKGGRDLTDRQKNVLFDKLNKYNL